MEGRSPLDKLLRPDFGGPGASTMTHRGTASSSSETCCTLCDQEATASVNDGRALGDETWRTLLGVLRGGFNCTLSGVPRGSGIDKCSGGEIYFVAVSVSVYKAGGRPESEALSASRCNKWYICFRVRRLVTKQFATRTLTTDHHQHQAMFQCTFFRHVAKTR